MRNATSIEGYKHTDEAKKKMVNRFENKMNHPFCCASVKTPQWKI